MAIERNLLDGSLHALGYARIDTFGKFESDSPTVRVDVMFEGGEITLDVPRSMVVDGKGVRMFQEDDRVLIEFRLGIEANTKSFQGNSYSKIGIKVKKVLQFRRLTADEQKAL